MSENKNKESWYKRTWEKSKKYIVGLFIALSPVVSSTLAHAKTASHGKGDHSKIEVRTDNFKNHSSIPSSALTSDHLLAYTGKYYNEVCNGSICWLSSQSETDGCGEEGPKKNISSAQIWSGNGLYAGINQMDATQRKSYLSWMKDKPEYQTIYEILKRKNTRSGWAKAAKTNEHLFLISQEDYMSSQYAPKKFKDLQTSLDKLNLNIDIRTIHPAIIGEMHKMLVQSPGAYKKIANVTKEFLSKHKIEELNSEAYAKAIAPCVKIGSKKLAPHTIEVMNDTSINWKEDQYIAALSEVAPKHPAKETWFDQHRPKEDLDFFEARAKQKMQEESIIKPSSLVVRDSAQELAMARELLASQTRKKIEFNKKSYRQQVMQSNKKPTTNTNLQEKRIKNAVRRAVENSKV